MKIKTSVMKYEDVLALPAEKHKRPLKQSKLFGLLLKIMSGSDLKATKFKCNSVNMEKLGKDEPCLYLMNHSSFIDLKIASNLIYPRPFNIVCTSDGFVGKDRLMRMLGCIPTRKFVSDFVLVKDMLYALRTLKSSVLMYPEASYSFDGTATPLPDSLGKCLKLLGVPVVMIRTYGAFARDPLYNNLQLRNVDVSADMEYILSTEDIAAKSAEELNRILKDRFTFDNFRWQQQNKIRIAEAFRADSLNRVLYKCPNCMAEGKTSGKGTALSCSACGKSWTLDEYGFMNADNGETEFKHIPDWFAWERECVKKEIETGKYRLEAPVDICVMVNTDCIYRVGSGTLVHSSDGFRLTGCDGRLDYSQPPQASYSLYSDYFWYEIGDMICIGNNDMLYYCFPKDVGDVAAKTRLATEEMYKIHKNSAVHI